jgi:deazaflavin-dependent oxidoreductase (nitroreductase family)
MQSQDSNREMTASVDSEKFLYLTTRGRNSGRPREIEIWFTRHTGHFYVIAEYATSHWVQNLRAHREVQVRVAGNAFGARARILLLDTDAPLIAAVQELSRRKYGWGEGLVVELAPAASAEPPEKERIQ